jgi:hypothetical protein
MKAAKGVGLPPAISGAPGKQLLAALYEVFCEERGPSLAVVDVAAAAAATDGPAGAHLKKQVEKGTSEGGEGGGRSSTANLPSAAPLTPLEKAEFYSTAQSLPGVASSSDAESAPTDIVKGGDTVARLAQWKDMSILLTEAVKLMFSKAEKMLGGTAHANE